MSTKDEVIDPYVRFYIQNGVEVATCLASDFRTAMNGRDALRAENEGLRRLLKGVHMETNADIDALRAEIERLKREVDYWMNLDAKKLEAENERLEEEANHMAGTLTACTLEIERLRAALLTVRDQSHESNVWQVAHDTLAREGI